jgi:GNAT superfamily N-acetyltransferase
MYEIKQVTFDEVFPIWENHLWLGRASQITPCSAIVYNTHPYKYDIEYQSSKPTFFGAVMDGKVVGVNSGHATGTGYRSRGLFVFPEHRGQNLGVHLLQKIMNQGLIDGHEYCWSMPRASALSSYIKAGFTIASEEFATETNEKNLFVSTTLLPPII